MLRDYLPRNLMGRSLLIVVTPLIILQVVSAYIFYESHWDQVSKRLALGLAGEVALLIDGIREATDPARRAWLFESAEKNMEITVQFEEGGILPNQIPGATALEGELRRALQERMELPVRVDARSNPGWVEINVQLAGGILTVVAPRGRLFSSTIYIFVLWTVGGSLILLGVATMFMRNQVRPVLRLARAAEAFGKGRDVPNFKPEGAREVRQAARAFVSMRARLQRQISQRTEMLAGVSHDLRTPLTRMKLQLAMMPADDGVRELKDDVDEMERMLSGYLAFARGEGGEKPENQDIVALLAEAVRQARRKGGVIELKADGVIEMPLRPDAFQRCINNLLDNAQRYGSRIVIRAKRRRERIDILIDDDGAGIPAARREDVFKPFFRLEGSRNPATGGVGLGLTIARDVIRGHGGELVLGDAPGGGLRVRIRLPL